ncbi:hypothetical protein J3F83DRAFT_759367 [Trichoderma novae-zelandiae]
MPRPLPNLTVHRQTVQPSAATDIRNLFTIQGALLRGDKSVTLHNTSRVTELDVQRLRIPYHPKNMPSDRPYESLFGYTQSSSSSRSNTTQPKLVGDFIDMLNWDGFRLEWVKVLGQGGFGMATLWNAIFEDHSSVKVVIKIPVRANANFKSELEWHLRYAGASHVAQSLDLQAMADDVRRSINRGHMIDRGARFKPSDLDVLVLEYADRGSMFDMMNRASHFNILFSNKVLWEIWECLVKGAVSVALQPDAVRRWGHDGLDKVLDSLDDPDNIAELYRISTLIDSHDVHFDLEEQNVLIAEDDHHGHHPIFKIHDFGEFSQKMRDNWKTWPEGEYWRMRRIPKKNRIPPETISREWDTFDPANPASVSRFVGDTFAPPKNEVAGRYGTWTNLFLIGKLMESVITKLWVSHPMSTMRYRPYDGRSDGQTYGWRVCRPEYQWIDLDLRCLILQCQYEKPGDRPPLTYLLRKIAERKQRGFPGEPDAQTRQFWDLFWAMQRPSRYPNPASSQTVVAFGNSNVFQSAGQTLVPSASLVPSSSLVPPASLVPWASPVPPPQGLATNPNTQAGYAASGNPLITHIAALRLSSNQSSPLMSSSGQAGPSIGLTQQIPYPPSGARLSAADSNMGLSAFASTAPLLGQPAAGQGSSSAEQSPMRPSAPMFGRPAAADSSGEEFPMRPGATTVPLVRPPVTEDSPIPDYFMRPTADMLPLRRPPAAAGPPGGGFTMRPAAARMQPWLPPVVEESSSEELPMGPAATATVAPARPFVSGGSSSEEFPMRATAVQLGRPPPSGSSSSEEFPMRATAVPLGRPPVAASSSSEELPMRPTATVVQVIPPAAESSSSEEFPMRPGATAVQLGGPPVAEASSSEESPMRPPATVAQASPPVAEASSSEEFPMTTGPTVAAAAATTTRKRSADDASEESGGTTGTTSTQRKRQRRVRFDTASVSSTVTMGMLPVHLVETATDESPGTLTRTWPIVANTPTPDPTVAVTDAPRTGTYVEHMRSLHNQYDPESTIALPVPEAETPRRSTRKRLAKFLRLDRLRDKFRRRPRSRAAGNAPQEGAPEQGQASRMGVDEGEQRGEAMDEDDEDEAMGEAVVPRARGDTARGERVWWGSEPRGGGNAGNAGMGERVWW